jgi:hypothetical protein
MHAQLNPKPSVRRRLGAAAMLLAAGQIALFAPAAAANAEAPNSPQDSYTNCINDEVIRAGAHPNMDTILTGCCAQAGGTPVLTSKGKFLDCTLPANSSPGSGSGHQPTLPTPSPVVIGHLPPDATHV